MNKFAKVAAASSLLLLASACGGGSDDGSADGGAPEEMTVWIMGDSQPHIVEYFGEAEAAWQEAHPGSALNVEFIPWPDVQTTLTNALAGGDSPDVIEIGNDQSSNWASQGALVDITETVDAWDEAADLDQNALEFASYEGSVYGVPWYSGVRTLYYRADWLGDLDIEPPTDWESLRDAAERINEEHDVPGFCAPTDFTNGIASFIWSNGGEIAVHDGSAWEGRLTDPATREAIEFYADLSADGDVSPSAALGANENDGCLNDMANGNLGMYIDGSWARGAWEGVAEDPAVLDQIETTVLPGADGMAPAFAGGSNLSVWSTTENPEAAAELLQLLAGKEWGDRFAETAGFFPAYPELLEQDKYTSDPLKAAGAEQMTNTQFFPATPNWNSADQEQKILPKAVLEIAQGGDAEEILAGYNDQLTEILNTPVE
ncbi:extracellular solute-binding protein [Actinorugispora endophytica]|uniref:N,N'-diacetylchitobiose transport system substrate-binding protein n=1 Tax=Actinorugispora endophytica TaxID=1605990 RepID=A0A4R6UXW1_9ACTN|nr:extracellular solute-binding protein [Actinorugispora endophytica]TDQ52108.1 N,N'-diacetylchitobiose transport system substrate-binding protein [Actinorugispora endophytica]